AAGTAGGAAPVVAVAALGPRARSRRALARHALTPAPSRGRVAALDAVRRAGPGDAVPVAGYGAPVRLGQSQSAAVLATVRLAAAGRLAHCARPRREIALSGAGLAGRRGRDRRLVPGLAAGTTATQRALDRTAV